MTKFLPIFPLGLVVYPGQHLNLHIFEPRYKQLVKECSEQKKTFGIPSVFGETLNEYGTEMELIEITKVHEGGELDVKTVGRKVFRIMEVIKEVPEKLYSAAVVFEVEQNPNDTDVLNPTLVDLIAELHKVLGTTFNPYEKFKHPLSYDVAPYIGLSQEDQYRLLAAVSEKGRQWFMIEHLQRLIPTLLDADKIKEKIRQNGHFKREIPPAF